MTAASSRRPYYWLRKPLSCSFWRSGPGLASRSSRTSSTIFRQGSRFFWNRTSSWSHRQSWDSWFSSTWVFALSLGFRNRWGVSFRLQSRLRSESHQPCQFWSRLCLIKNSSISSPSRRRWGVWVSEWRPSCSSWLRGRLRSRSCGCGIWLSTAQVPSVRICLFRLMISSSHKASTECCCPGSARNCCPSCRASLSGSAGSPFGTTRSADLHSLSASSISGLY